MNAHYGLMNLELRRMAFSRPLGRVWTSISELNACKRNCPRNYETLLKYRVLIYGVTS